MKTIFRLYLIPMISGFFIALSALSLLLWSVMGCQSFAQRISGGYLHSLAVKSDGTVWSWGRNIAGQLGDNTTTQRLTPVQVHGSGDVGFLTDITYVAGGEYLSNFSIALKNDETVWTWGANTGQLGDNTTVSKITPVQVHGPGDVGFLTGITAVSTGANWTACQCATVHALKNDGTVWGWGQNNNGGPIGDGTTTNRWTPVQVHGPGDVGFLTDIKAIASGGGFTLALKNDGTVWAWGYNGWGTFGDNSITSSSTPVQVHGPGDVGFLTNIIAIAAGSNSSFALKNDGTVWAWGGNGDGELGDNTSTSRLTPVQVLGPGGSGFLTGITAIASGTALWSPPRSHTLALKNDGTVWAWGYNSTGQLGDNTTTTRLTPVQVHGSGDVGFLTGITALATGSRHSLAIKDDCTVWAWGYNINGQLGDNSTTQRNTPVQISGLCLSLPVIWLSFTAEPTGNTVRLEWTTATEINNDYFSIERSKDGNFSTAAEVIGKVDGAGNSTTSLSYIFYDEHPYSGISYYRIKQTDYDGKYKYSDVRAVFRGEMELISINPNPADDFINYQVGSPDGGEVTLKIIDITGKAVITQAEVLEKGVTTKKLSTANFSSGVYLLQITTPNKEKTQKQFVVK